MRRNLLLSILIALCIPLLGNPVNENTAKQLAQNFWKENNIIGIEGDRVFKKRMDDAQFMNIAPQCGYTEFYIFNNEDGKGFVIIAADDCVTPILGYSYNNNFATENLPPNIKGWLDGYAEQIRVAIEMRVTATEEIRDEWNCLRQGKNLPIRSETAVSSLVASTWSQGQYYNMLCPEDNNGQDGHALTGCVATAMAQILRYWEYPNDAHSVIWHEYEHPVYGTLDANYSYSGGSYYWNFMPDQLTSSSSTNQIIAVASLMYHCGVSVEMDYGPDVSSAYGTAAEIAFRAFFDYNDATLIMKSSYTDTQWISILKNELDNGRPVYYAGSGPDGGHAFVCDGYNNSNYFYFNWGWGGSANGTFLVSALTPTVNGYQFDFSDGQHAIIGIEPGGTNSYHLLGMNDDIKLNGYYGNIYCFDTQIQEITTEVYNWGNTAFNGSLCAVVFDREKQYMAESEFINNCQIPPMQSSGQLSFTFSEPLNILPCKAEVRIYSIENNQFSLVFTYGMHQNPSEFYNYYTNSSDMVELYLYSNIEYSPSSIAQNSAINVTANIINDDNDPNLTFNGYYAAALYGLNGELKQILAVLHEVNGLPPGYHYTSPLTFSCPSVNVPTGTYYLTIIQQLDGSDNWYPLLNWEDCVNPEYVNPIRVEVVNSIIATANPNNGGTVTCDKRMIAEDFESYPTSNNIATAAHAVGHNYWTTWNNLPGSSEDGYVVNFNGNQCGHFTYGNDQVLRLNNINSGIYDLKFDVLVPQGKNGYFSILHHFAGNNSTWAMQCYLHLTNDGQTSTSAPGHGTLHAGSNSTADLPCVYDEWMHFRIHVDTDEDVAQLYFNVLGQPESMYAEWQWSLDSFGEFVSNYIFDALDFFPPENTASEFYVDNIVVSKETNSFYYGDICALTATPNNGYAFINWTENGTQVSTNADYTFTVTGNKNLVANFQPQLQQYTINVSANPNNGGSVSTTGELSYNFDNGFDGWTTIDADGDGYNWRTGSELMGTGYGHNGSNDLLVSQSYDNDYGVLYPDNYLVSPQVALGGSISFWACAQDNSFPSEHFGVAVSTTSNTNANSFTTIQEWTMTAKSEGKYSDRSRDGISRAQGIWYHYSVDLSTYSGQTGYIAIRHFNCNDMFYLDIDDVSINTIGDNTFYQGQTCTVNATANSGYTFVNWTENGTQVSTNPSYSFTVNGNRDLVANFQAQPQQYTINVSASPSNGGSVSGGGTFNQGQTCTVNATANSGYTFVNWTENGTQVSTNANYSFPVTGNRTLVAHFTTQNYIITAIADPSTGGNVTGSGGYNHGESCTLTATANAGYTFINWTKNGTQVSSNPTYTFAVTETATYVAHFSIQNYTISATSSPSNGGTTTGGGTYNYGQTCTVTASAANGFAFTNWTENGTQVSTNASYSFTVTNNRNLVANFAQNTYTITATAGANGFITPSGTVVVADGSNQTFTIIPDYGYEIYEVYVDGGHIGAPSSYTFQNVTSNHTIFATFIRIDGIDDNNGMAFVIYPNPTSGIVNILCQDAELFNIYDTYGQLLISQNTNGNDQVTIDISNLPSGIYLIQLVSKEGLATKQIIKIP